jgi:hypothetical protein
MLTHAPFEAQRVLSSVSVSEKVELPDCQRCPNPSQDEHRSSVSQRVEEGASLRLAIPFPLQVSQTTLRQPAFPASSARSSRRFIAPPSKT